MLYPSVVFVAVWGLSHSALPSGAADSTEFTPVRVRIDYTLDIDDMYSSGDGESDFLIDSVLQFNKRVLNFVSYIRF